MRKPTIRMAVCALLDLPIVMVRYVLTYLNYRLAACDMKLRCGDWPEMHKEAAPESDNVPGTPYQSKRYNIDCVMQFVSMGKDCSINKVRQGIEIGPVGRRVVMCYRNRHLYAVLKPNRVENMQRILNVLTVMDTETIRKCRAIAEAKSGKET